MSLPEYEIHVSHDRLSSLWGDEDESEAFPFYEDIDELDRIIEEEIGSPKRKRGTSTRHR